MKENSTSHYQCRPRFMAASQKLCHHGEMVTEDIFIQKWANMNNCISPVELHCSMYFWGNVTGKKPNALTRESTIKLEQLQDSGHTCYVAAQDGLRGINWHSYILTSNNSQTNQQSNPKHCTLLMSNTNSKCVWYFKNPTTSNFASKHHWYSTW
jgi:hypothetical protein